MQQNQTTAINTLAVVWTSGRPWIDHKRKEDTCTWNAYKNVLFQSEKNLLFYRWKKDLALLCTPDDQLGKEDYLFSKNVILGRKNCRALSLQKSIHKNDDQVFAGGESYIQAHSHICNTSKLQLLLNLHSGKCNPGGQGKRREIRARSVVNRTVSDILRLRVFHGWLVEKG